MFIVSIASHRFQQFMQILGVNAGFVHHVYIRYILRSMFQRIAAVFYLVALFSDLVFTRLDLLMSH